MNKSMSNTKKNGNAANNGGKWIRADKRLAIYLRDGLSCAYCGAEMEHGDTQLTLDHVAPQELGGSNEAENLVCCCKRCNSAKQDKPVKDFIAYLAEQSIDTSDVPARIRRRTRRSIQKWRRVAKQIIAARKAK